MIKRFGNFINENVELPVLDMVIDENGDLYDGGSNSRPLMKGSVERKSMSVGGVSKQVITNIFGDDGAPYIGGIDKNGKLFGLNIDPKSGNLRDLDSSPLKVPDYILNENPQIGQFWNNKVDYSSLLTTLPTGWVNVKVDMEIIKRVRRYSSGMSNGNGSAHEVFIEKLKDIQKVSKGLRYTNKNKKRETVQKQLSAVMLLHYINEIKNFFTPSSAGFLFESFIAGLIPNSKVKEDNSKCDIESEGKEYQIKLYKDNGTPPLTKGGVDYHIVCLKRPTKIDIYVLKTEWKHRNHDDYYGKFLTPSGNAFSIKKLNDYAVGPNSSRYSLDLTNIDEKINMIAVGLKSALDTLYKELSKFQYNIETIITGVDEKGDIIGDSDFMKIREATTENLNIMSSEVNTLLQSVDYKHRSAID